jgi:hypothetical protein
MPTGTPNVPLDSRGRPLAGIALEVHLRKQAELAAAAEAREDVAALARVVCRLAARGLGLPAADALAALGVQAGPAGRGDALRVLRCAGIDPEPQAHAWAEQAPIRQQASRGRGWDGDPEHHPEVVALIRTPGVPMQAVLEKIAEVAERQARERAAQRAASPGVLWATRDGKEVREERAPVPLQPQRSIIRENVPPLGAEPA